MENNNGIEIEMPDTDISVVEADGPTVDAVIMPAGTYKELYKAIKVTNEVEDENFTDKYSENEALAVGIMADGLRTTVRGNTLVNTLKEIDSKWTQNPQYADKTLALRELPVNNKKGGELTGAAALTAFYSQLGLGGIIQVPLWHSGFWISLKPIKESDLLQLEMQIGENQIKLGRETNTLIYSNYSVVFTRLVLEFITRHIQSTTLNLTNINDVVKYIKMQDLFPLINGLIQSIYMKGFKDVRTCNNSLNIDSKTGKPKCSHTISSTIDPKKLLWVNRKAFTDKHMDIMILRRPDSVTVNQVLEYQSTLEVNKDVTYDFKSENGTSTKVTLKMPTLDKHIDSGEKWVNGIIKLTEDLFTEKLSIEEKNLRVNASSKMVLLGAYRHFVTKIEFGDGSVVVDDDTIDKILEAMVSDNDMFKEFMKVLRKHVDTHTAALIGIPKYRCPNCSIDQGSGESVNKSFEDIIPINVLESFFDLSILKTSKISERTLDERI